MKVVIVGGVAGGATTAARLRRIAEHAEILILERGGHISYANCGLPYYIGEVIPERERLFVQTPENFKRSFNIDVKIHSEVTAVDRERKIVHVRNTETDETWEEPYDTLVLSPGAEPIKPPIPGINSEGIFTLRSVPETDAIKSFVDERRPKKAVVVGAGFIGLEMAENLHERGVFVTIVEMAEQVMNVVDYEMAAMVHQHLKTKNVEFYLQDGVSSFAKDGDTITITLQSGKQIEANMVILSIGVRPEGKLAKESDLSIGTTGGIKVNEYLQTSDPDIYAVGDAIEFAHPITKQPTITYLAGPANKQGRICANNIVFGPKEEYEGAIGTAAAKIFDLTVASTGASEKSLMRTDIPFKTVITHSSSHAGYYPDAMPLTIKTIFSPETGALLGAQAVGYEGVDKRIDLMATVVRKHGTIHDLTEIEHAYAPPYSSAKDPVNIAGFVAENVYEKRSRHIQWREIMGCDLNELALIDVRTPEEFELGTIEGSVNIPTYELRDRLDELSQDKTLVVFCGVGLRAYHAEQILLQHGFESVYNLSGGYKTYETTVQKQANEDLWERDYVGNDDNIYQSEVEGARSFSGHAAAPTRQGAAASATAGAATAAEGAGLAASASKPLNRTQVEVTTVDASGLQCPGPIMKLKKSLEALAPGAQLREIATDPGFGRDVESWCRMTGNQLIALERDGAKTVAVVEKGPGAAQSTEGAPLVLKESTLVVFSDDMDRALASLVLANGAASAGKEVTMFFTFWGLSLLKKDHKPKVRKDFMGRMFSRMLPKMRKQLKLSKMNFGGVGAAMMKSRMKQLNVDSLDQMLEHAVEGGVRLVACQMSMDMMGIAAEELIDGVEVGGVATYMEHAAQSNVNLFI